MQSAIRDAYRIFGQYQVNDDLDFAADVGVSDEENSRLFRALISTPLQSLPVEVITAYFDYINAAHDDGAFRAEEFRLFSASCPGTFGSRHGRFVVMAAQLLGTRCFWIVGLLVVA